jgi:hypothetical protein
MTTNDEMTPWQKYQAGIKKEVKPWDVLNPNTEWLNDEDANKRYDICLSCPQLINLTKQCKKCGCFMSIKTKLKDATCPLNKWVEDIFFYKTIFINIPSYKDLEIWMTIDDFIKNAKNPDRVYFGITHQSDNIEKETLIYNTYDKDKVLIDIFEPGLIVGCQPARKNSHKFYNNQDYYLNMDSHMRSIQNWDELIINEFEDIEKRKGKSVITGYVNDYDLDDENNPILKISTPWIYKMSNDNIENFKNTGIVQMIPSYSNHIEEIESPYVSGHFFFTRSEYIKRVGFVDNITFTEEEMFMALRFFTAGYNLFIPKKTYVLHRYGRPNRKLFWEDFPEKFYESDVSSKKFFNNIVVNNVIDNKIGLFKDRSLSDFEEYSGINFKSREVIGKLLE